MTPMAAGKTSLAPSGQPKHVTLDQLAREAGVSTATASRVINGNPSVAPAHRDAVQRAVKRLKFVPNRAARNLASRRSNSIGLVLPELITLSGDAYFPRLIAGVSEALAPLHLQLVIMMPSETSEHPDLEQYVASGHVDGLIVMDSAERDPLLDYFTRSGLPFVTCGRPSDRPDVSYVDCDNVGGTALAIRHLAEMGCTTIGTIAGPPVSASGVDRLASYQATLRELGREPDDGLIAVGDYTFGSGQRAVRDLLQRRPELDGLFIAGEHMALGALAGLLTSNRRVPTDVALVSFDDSPPSASTLPPLSSVRQPIEAMGRELVRLLIGQIEGDTVTHRVVLGTELKIRESSLRQSAK